MANFKYLDKDGLLYLWGLIKTKLSVKVDKIEGKMLSDNNFTTPEKIKYDGYEAQINTVNTESDAHIGDKGNPHTVTKIQVGLSYVDNTSDLTKPVSTATNTALELKADKLEVTKSLALKANQATTYTKTEVDGIFDEANTPLTKHIGDKVNPHDVTKAQVGLGSVDNTNDLAKPVSTSTTIALGLKADKVATTTSLNTKVDKVTGKGLSTVDVTTTMKNQWNTAQANVIESIKLNGVKVTPSSGKEVSLTVITGAQVDSKITTAIGNIVLFTPKVVSVLPATGVANILYIVPKTGGGGTDVHSEYLWVNGKFEYIGATKVDLSGYVKNTDLIAITNSEIDGVLAT